MERQRIGLIDFKITISRKACDGDIILDGRTVEFLHNGAADAASGTGRHFYKASVQFSAFDILERGYTVFRPVDRHICVARILMRQRFQYSARRREKARAAVPVCVYLLLQLDIFGLEPCGELVERKHRIDDSLIILRFILFCDAGSDEHGFCLGNASLYILAVRLHGGKHGRKIRKLRREVFLYKKIDRVAARCDYNVAGVLVDHSFVFVFYDRCADRGLLGIEEAELFERFAHGLNTDALIICDK